jgi:crotonobetainyl-CoA:carnitine CoA-transferase CaiB-like acyl-CoA transferase
LIPLLEARFREASADTWLERLWSAQVPAGVIHDVPEAFAAPAAQARDLVDSVPHPTLGQVKLIRSPLRFSETPVTAPTAPPLLGEHTAEVLTDVLDKTSAQIAELVAAGAIRLA